MNCAQLPEQNATTESVCSMRIFGKMKICKIDSDCFRVVPSDEGHLCATLEWLDVPVDPMSSAFLNATLDLSFAVFDGRLARGDDEIISRAYDFSNTLKHFAVDPTMLVTCDTFVVNCYSQTTRS